MKLVKAFTVDEIIFAIRTELFQQNKLLNIHIRIRYSILKLRLSQTEKTKGISTMIVVWICAPFNILSSFTIHEKDK